jgi:hypothetical protein
MSIGFIMYLLNLASLQVFALIRANPRCPAISPARLTSLSLSEYQAAAVASFSLPCLLAQ